jgi:Alpha/beta hydrolase of unknown function (DUF900)
MNYFNLEKCHFRYRSYHNSISVVLILLFTLPLFPSSYVLLKIDNAWATTTGGRTIPVYMLTTRGGLDSPQSVPEPGYDGNPLGDINQLRRDCPREVAIFVHGWAVSSDAAKEQLDRVKMSLENNTYYNVDLIGYTWGSDIELNNAKILAKNEGVKLAQFISELAQGCSGNIEIRLLAHSLGSRVVLSSLNALNNMPPSSIDNFKILSVHLMGAAVDDEKISKNPFDADNSSPSDNGIVYGIDIENHVTIFHNLFDPEDNYLQSRRAPSYYPIYENDSALGRMGADATIVDLPRNYRGECAK